MATFTWSNANGGSWSDDGNWSPSGVPGAADTALIALAGQYDINLDVVEIGSLTLDAAGVTLRPSGTLRLDGSVDVRAGTLAVSHTIQGGTLVADGGTILLGDGTIIQGGTIETNGTGLLYSGSATLSGVTIDGTLGVDIDPSAGQGSPPQVLTIENGLTFTGTTPGQIVETTANATLGFIGNQTLDNVDLTLGNSTLKLDGTLTLGPASVTTLTAVETLGTPYLIFDLLPTGKLVNQGTIIASGGGFSDTLDYLGRGYTLENDGVFTASNASNNSLYNLSNTGTLSISGAGSGLSVQYLENTGTIALSDGAGLGVAGVRNAGQLQNVGTIDLSRGASLELQAGSGGLGKVSFQDGTGTLILNNTYQYQPIFQGGTSGSLDMFQSGDVLDLGATPNGYLLGSYSLSHTGDTLTVYKDGRVYADLGLTGQDYSNATFTLTDDIVTTDAPCFCTGTRILTDRGERPVELLSPGDRVITRQDGTEVTLTVRWVGRRRVRVGRHPEPDRVHPVCIRRDAVAPGLPSRDLYLSPDHAVFLDGMLIQARQLVNGVTVLRDAGRRTVTYHHVELERHAVLLADGLPCESYLDTGNRAHFDNAAIVTLHPAFGRADDPGACAPLVTEGDRIHPVWLAIAARASRTDPLPDLRTTREAEPCLVLADGSVLRPEEIGADGRHVFRFDDPAMAGRVRLRSRCGAACDVRPWLDDRRRLGVAVSGLTAWTRQGDDEPTSLDLDGLPGTDGWWATERDGTHAWRWTNGDATLEPPPGCCRLDVLVTGTVEYRLDPEPASRAA